MPAAPMYRYIFAISLFWVATTGLQQAYAQADTATEAEEDGPPARKKYVAGHQLTIGVDLLNPVLNNLVNNRYSYEGEISYYLKNEYYAVLEGGWGGSDVKYTDLQYATKNSFGRIGFNKSILYRQSENDWDMMFIGLRGAFSNVNRSAVNYTVTDSLWGNSTGVGPSKDFLAAWAEITMGMRVEFLRGFMAGWNLRGKFLMNGKSFKDLAPLNIAGYGKGDKNSSFDFTLYVCYAIRWNRASTTTDK